MKLKDYLQSDDFATMEYDDKVDYLKKAMPNTFGKQTPTEQRKFVFNSTKQPNYKQRDLISKAAGYGLPLAGQFGGEAVGGAAGGALGLPTGPEPLAAALGGGAVGGGLGAAAAEVPQIT